MPHHVYANNNEICSKSADGTSELAVDVCFSPGAPMPGVPISYMNACKASDIANGSTTVFIKGMEICLEDKSFFATSYGDEPATKAMKKGTVSGAVQGKCYFTSWSPNVKVEGLSVTRHMDLVTHNHSNPPNTPQVYYMSVAAPPADCKRGKKRMEDRCKPEKKGTGKTRNNKRASSQDTAVDGNWVIDHCGPLLVKPGVDFNQWWSEHGSLDKLLAQATDALKSQVITRLEQEVVEFATKKALAFAARRGLTGWIPVVGWVVTAVDVVSTGIEIAEKIPEMKDEIADLKNIANELDKQSKQITGLLDEYKDKIANYKNLSPKEQEKVAREVMAGVQSAYGAANPCMRARKCFLVPFNKTESEAASWKGDACCPGQTGHHLMPDTMFRDPSPQARSAAFEKWKATYTGQIAKDQLKMSDMPRDKLPTKKCWGGYTEGGAPTVCLEGTDNHSGSHGAMHKATDALLSPFEGKGDMSYEKARDLVVGEMHVAYGCNKECLAAQLDDYYKNAHSRDCGPLSSAKVNPSSGAAGGSKASGGKVAERGI